MAQLIMSVKPGTSSILVYEPISASIDKLMEAIFCNKARLASKRLHIKGNRYMYIPSDEYKLIRVKNFAK
jgi:hypothetical protein